MKKAFTILLILISFCLNGCETSVIKTDGPHYEHYTLINEMMEPLKISGISHDNKEFKLNLSPKENYSLRLETLDGKVEEGKTNIITVKSIRFESISNGIKEFQSNKINEYRYMWKKDKKDCYSLHINESFFN